MGNTWAVDLADMGAVYPWVGTEMIMVLVAVLLWLLWHVVQIREEKPRISLRTSGALATRRL